MKPPRSVWVDLALRRFYLVPADAVLVRYDMYRPKAKPRKRRKGAK